MANEANIADHRRTIWDEPLRATVAMAMGQELMGYRLEAFVARRGWVYFIAASCGSIKIGRAKNVPYRLEGLQIGNPQELKVVAVVPDGSLERDYHRRFAEHRLHGEWFEPHPDILAEIERLSQPLRPERN